MSQQDEPHSQVVPIAWSDPKNDAVDVIKCPGKFEQLPKEANAVLQVDNFDGVRFDMQKVVSPVLFLGHHFTMGGAAKESYALSATFAPDQGSFMAGRIDPSGQMMARMARQITSRLTGRVEAQLAPRPQPAAVNLEADYTGPTYTANGKYSNEGFFSLGAVKAFTPHLAIGVDAFHHPRIQAIQVAARHETQNYVAYGMWASFGVFQLSYMRKASARVGLATSLQYNAISGESVLEAGYNFNLRQANIKAKVDSQGTVGCVVEEKIMPGFSLMLSGFADHMKNDFKFGFGVTLG